MVTWGKALKAAGRVATYAIVWLIVGGYLVSGGWNEMVYERLFTVRGQVLVFAGWTIILFGFYVPLLKILPEMVAEEIGERMKAAEEDDRGGKNE